jgi:hypothetical protein
VSKISAFTIITCISQYIPSVDNLSELCSQDILGGNFISTFKAPVEVWCIYMYVLSRVRGSMTNNNEFWIGWLDLLTHSFTITLNYDRWLPKARSTPSWTTSVFSSIVTDLVLVYESVTSSASVVRWLTLHSWTLNPTQLLNFWTLLLLNHDWLKQLCVRPL